MPAIPLVETSRKGAAGLITLRNERALNALTLDMIHAIHPQLDAWRDDPDLHCVVIEGAGERAFCAGGDVRAVALAGRSDDRRLTRSFFWHEYRLNRAIAVLPKPYVALIDGITMGGGVGLSAHGAFQVATERTVWSMPETAIGFFPDVGASHVLNGLEPAMAAFLALTGWRLGAGDMVALGLATHFVPAERLDEVKAELAAGRPPAAALDAHAAESPPAALAGELGLIHDCFGWPTVEEILAALERAGGDFARKAASIVARMSPLSCKVTLEELHRTRGLDLDQCLQLEFRLSQHFMAGHDFFEGIRALLIDKDQAPKWQPAALAEIDNEMVEACFAPPAEGELGFEPDATP
jgi:enoyl-CoA hydratase